MRVLILEPHSSGHHASYVRWLLEGVCEHGWSCTLCTTTEVVDHPLIRTLPAEVARDVEFYLLEPRQDWNSAVGGRWRQLRRELGYLSVFRRAVREVAVSTPVDAVILPYVDYCFHAIALWRDPYGGIPWCGISMRLGWLCAGTDQSPPWKWRVARRLIEQPSLLALFSISPSTRDVPRQWFDESHREKLRYLPDPAEQRLNCSRSEARRKHGIGEGEIVVLVFGTIDERKGLDALVSCLAQEPQLSEFRVVVAGRQSATMKERMRGSAYEKLRRERRLIEMDALLDDAEQATVFAMADVAWVAYADHAHMSGVLVLAGRCGLPVIASRYGEVGMLVRKEAIGEVVELNRREDVRSALLTMRDVATRARYGERGRDAFADHTVANFTTALLDAVVARTDGRSVNC